jgi:hypothetical protein
MSFAQMDGKESLTKALGVLDDLKVSPLTPTDLNKVRVNATFRPLIVKRLAMLSEEGLLGVFEFVSVSSSASTKVVSVVLQ